MGEWRAAKGFTLAELLVSLAVLGLLMAGMVALLHAGLGSYGWGRARVEAQQSARTALERMVKELREAGYDPTGAKLAAVLEAGPERVTFQRDLNENGVIDPTRERVSFFLRGTVLRREAGGGAQPIIEGVRSLALHYFDLAGAPTGDPAKVASIGIHLSVGLDGPQVTMSTRVSLRSAGR